MADLQHAVPGQPFVPRASDWNAFVDAARVVRDARTIFGVPRLDGGGGGGEAAGLIPVIILGSTSSLTITPGVVTRTAVTVWARRIEQPFAAWQPIDGAEGELLDVTLLRGVVFHGQLAFAATIPTGTSPRLKLIGGWGGDCFHECVTVGDIEAGDDGYVKLRYTDNDNERQEAQVLATNTLNRGLSANQVCTLVTFCDALQRFQIISASCEYEEV